MLHLPPIPRLVMPSVIMTDTKRKGRNTEFYFLLIASLLYFLDDGSLFVLLKSFYRAWLDTRFHLSSSITTQICQNRSCRTPLQYDSEKNQACDGSVQTRELQSKPRELRSDPHNRWCYQRSRTPEPSMYSEHTK